MPATRKGIFHNLRQSKYTVSNTEIVFFFSSKIYMNKFMTDYENNRITFSDKINKVMVKEPYNMNTLADINLYLKIEKRGFYVWLKGVSITCEELHQYGLRQMTKKNTLNWREIHNQKSGVQKKNTV